MPRHATSRLRLVGLLASVLTFGVQIAATATDEQRRTGLASALVVVLVAFTILLFGRLRGHLAIELSVLGTLSAVVALPVAAPLKGPLAPVVESIAPHWQRLLPTPVNPNALAIVLLPAPLVLLAFAVVLKAPCWRVPLAVSSIVGLLVIASTGSRTALVAAGAGVAVLVALVSSHTRRTRIIALALMASALAATAVPALGSRWQIWHAAASSAISLVGSYGEFAKQSALSAAVSIDERPLSVHDTYLQLLLDFGVLGLGSWLAINMLAVAVALRGLDAKSPWQMMRACNLAGVVCIAAIAVAGVAESTVDFTISWDGAQVTILSPVPFAVIALALGAQPRESGLTRRGVRKAEGIRHTTSNQVSDP